MAHLPGTPRRKAGDREITDERLRQAILTALRNQPFQVSGLALRTQATSYAHLANILYAADWLRGKCTLVPPTPGARPPFVPEYRKRTFRKADTLSRPPCRLASSRWPKTYTTTFYQFLEGLAEKKTAPLDIPADLTPA